MLKIKKYKEKSPNIPPDCHASVSPPLWSLQLSAEAGRYKCVEDAASPPASGAVTQLLH